MTREPTFTDNETHIIASCWEAATEDRDGSCLPCPHFEKDFTNEFPSFFDQMLTEAKRELADVYAQPQPAMSVTEGNLFGTRWAYVDSCPISDDEKMDMFVVKLHWKVAVWRSAPRSRHHRTHLGYALHGNGRN